MEDNGKIIVGSRNSNIYVESILNVLFDETKAEVLIPLKMKNPPKGIELLTSLCKNKRLKITGLKITSDTQKVTPEDRDPFEYERYQLEFNVERAGNGRKKVATK